ncbi:centrosomal protein of 112 kDa [Pungitius pungitius]|uniref:centrosomal protein of 112 kDa n=1 Tax=Pungitius pungitius TaxID=134920 RepID=UPI002E127CDD
MSRHQHSWERLDAEFDHFLLDMKPYVLKHPSKTERQRCAVWVKKLCDPASCGSGVTGRKNRNAHARLLLHMLKRGVLERPFTSKPEPGGLKALPTYVSIYFEEPLRGGSEEHCNAGLPDWVTGELGGYTDDSLTASLLKDRVSSTPIAAHHRRQLYEDRTPPGPVSSGPHQRSQRHDARRVDAELKADASPDDSDLEARLNSWNLGIESPRYLRGNPIPFSPISKPGLGGNGALAADRGPQPAHGEEAYSTTEMAIKLLESKHQEEKLKLQQRHDADVEKILDRKNAEIEETKSLHRAKQKESEEMIRKLERKVQSVTRESQAVCESKEKQIAELKKMSDQSTDSLRNEWEKKLHAAVTEMEQDKFKLQKKHTENIQELLEDTNLRLAQMEAEYIARSRAAEQTQRALELRVKQQSAEVEKGNALRQRMTREKAQLETHVVSISTELQEANRRNTVLQKEKEQHEQELRVQHETQLSHLHQEHDLSAAKSSEVMGDLEKTIAALKQQLLDVQNQSHQQVKDQETRFHQETDEVRIDCEKKVLAIQNEAENERTEATRKIAKLEDALREMESQLDRARESQRQQIQQADAALEQFRKQVELSAEKTYADMNLQMEKVEEDLIRSKSLREKQAKEFSQQLDALRQKYEQQMAEQRVQHEQERTRLQQQHSAEKDILVQERQWEVGSLERQAKAALQQHQQHSQEWRKRDGQTIADLGAQLSGLRDELQEAQAQHKRQLAEAALFREEEQRAAFLDKEASLDRLRADMERVRADLEESHRQERDAAQEKSDSRLKQIEREYGQKLAKSAQLIAQLQTSVCDSKDEAVGLQQATEKRLKESSVLWDEERRTMIQHADRANKVTAVRQECEEKIKGLMPAALRQELEDTIASLKAQVNFLQKRASVLQEDLDACRSRR